MGKTKRKGDKVPTPSALSNVLHDDKLAKAKKRNSPHSLTSEAENNIIDERLSRKILKTVQQQQEFETDPTGDATNEPQMSPMTWKSLTGEQNVQPQSLTISKLNEEDDIDPLIEPSDEKEIELFMSAEKKYSEKRGIDLNQLIRERLGMVNEAIPDDGMTEDGPTGGDIANMERASNLKPELKSVFIHVGQVMSQWRSGKFPKAFKEIPNLRDWEEALWLTNPHQWSAASLFQATRTFASSMSDAMAQRYYNLVLLPRVRDDIAFYGKLNFHIYEAIMKAVFKPTAFIRGFLLPLCQEGNCTLREATIISAILRDKSVPLQHTSAAMLKIAEMQYNGANSIFLRTMIEKKYALPYRVLDAMVFHFIRFRDDERKMPVLWHQCFLSFVKLYGKDLSNDQKKAMLILTKKQVHKEIGPEVRKTILETCPRDIELGTGDEMDAMAVS